MTLPTVDTVLRPQSAGYEARVDDLLLRLAPGPERPVRIETAELQPPRFQTEANPEDVVSSFGDIHSQSDFTGGEGLLNRFRRSGSDRDPTRFWDSQGIDVSPSEPGQRESLRLLPTTSLVDANTGTARLANADQIMWVTAGTGLRRTDDILAATPTFVDDDPHAGEGATTVGDVATLGDVPYAALGANGVHRNTGGGWAHWSDVAATRVWTAFDRVIASTGTALYEAAAGAGSTLLYTLPDGETWTDVVDSPGAILASASNGFVYSFALNDTAVLEVVAQSLLKGETPDGLATRGQLVWVATTSGTERRLWQAEVQAGALVDLQLLREWTSDSPVLLTTTRDRTLAGVREGHGTFVWQLALATGGLSRGIQIGGGQVDGLFAYSGTTVAGVAGSGVWRETDTLVDDGYLIGPLSDFFRPEDKTWVTGWADVDIASGWVELWYTTDPDALSDPDHHAWVRLRTYHPETSLEEVALGSVVSRALAGMVRLYRDGGISPTVRSMSFRSYPTGGDLIVQLPVDVGDQVERHGRRRVHIPGWGRQVYDRIAALGNQAVVVEVFRTGDIVRGVVENVQTPVPALTPRGTATQVSYMTVRGRRITVIGLDTPWGGYLGGGVLGAYPLGGST